MAGQYLRIAVLVRVSAIAALGLRLVGDRWVGLFGDRHIAPHQHGLQVNENLALGRSVGRGGEPGAGAEADADPGFVALGQRGANRVDRADTRFGFGGVEQCSCDAGTEQVVE